MHHSLSGYLMKTMNQDFTVHVLFLNKPFTSIPDEKAEVIGIFQVSI
jgi:hypothetical protein